MASDQTLRAVITVLDKTVEPIARINERFRGMQAPLRELSQKLGAFAEETGLKSIAEHAGGALEKVKQLGESLAEIAAPLGALSAAGSIAGLAEMAKSAAEYGEKLSLASQMTGVGTEKLAGLQYAARLANIDMDQFNRGLVYLNRNIGMAATGKAKDVESILNHMGLQNSAGHLVGTADALRDISAEVQHLVAGGQTQLATAMLGKLFGERQGAELMPLFAEGPKALAKAMAEAKESGLTLSESQAEQGRKFMDQWKGMEASVQGLSLAIGGALLPVLTPIVRGMRDWLNANREWLAHKINHAVKEVVLDIKAIDWSRVKDDILAVGHDIKWAVDKVGGFKHALEIVAAISLAPTIMEFGSFAGAVATAAAKLIAFPVAGFIGSVATLIPEIGSFRDVWVALNVAMDANPLGAAVLAVTALGGAAYELYEHWDKVSAFFKGLWADIESIFAEGWHKIEPIVHAFEHAAHWVGGFLPSDTRKSVAESADFDPNTGMPLPGLGRQTPLPALPGARAAAGVAAGAPQKGENKLTVDFKNLPPGATVKSETRGSAPEPDVNLGYSMALGSG